MEINYDDNFLSQNEYESVLDYCINTEYSFGERDDENLPPTGMVRNIEKVEMIYDLFSQRLEEKCSFLKDMKLYRMYVNCFAPGENPYFHTDGEGLTFLYYVNPEWNVQEGGETQFYVDDNVYGVSPIPNRLVMFNGMILHRATSFRSQHRFTVAIKYEDK